jgi:hypothetical protein
MKDLNCRGPEREFSLKAWNASLGSFGAWVAEQLFDKSLPYLDTEELRLVLGRLEGNCSMSTVDRI